MVAVLSFPGAEALKYGRSPLVSDHSATMKKFLCGFAAMGIVATTSMIAIEMECGFTHHWSTSSAG